MLLAIDPGKEKIGLAVLNNEGKVIEKRIVFLKNLQSYLISIFNKYNIEQVVLGNGTGCNDVKAILAENEITIANRLYIIEEKNSTEEAERLYREEKQTILNRIVFKIINWKPAIALDDYTAVILGRRYLKEIDKKNGKN